jgi:sugar phosphate isomerase/epimerase
MLTHQTSRRQFLKIGAGALSATALRPRLLLGADGAPDFGGLKLGIQSYTLRDRTFVRMLQAMRDPLKLHYVELYLAHLFPNSPPPILDEAKKKLAAADVQAISFGVVGFTNDHDSNRKLFEFAKTMGMTNISADPNPDSFDSLDKLVDEYKITVAIHDHGPGHRYGKIQQIWDAVKDHNPKIGLCNDTGHFIRAGEDPLEACEKFKDRLFAVHLKDFKPKGDDWEDCALGDGKLKLRPIVKWLLDHQFHGGAFIEYEGGDPVRVTQECIKRVQAAVGG